ncbi:class I SAM-dependent methyltransferase [Sphingobacterium sp. UT-1RO-CII-1]|uniref:class I SAM-dependent methyltransferase n=1 Tax=Sphingobacterium sp. UT-1RO-CII-1 TaxID=2995225 RepID=UPI00227C243E|nr:class I SAM-dependent methyltransferase [Sphingobacterium sp. UT-1RO-CII-1]MCY4781312.1 class I SAM-dependent methyltransferase [Sphingobacterium sp. UT-1RO-CII-1]
MKEISSNKSYGNLCSLFYDIDKPTPEKEELAFYLSFVEEGMEILEPMCGSGRFLISFLNRGYNIDGFDLSSDMVEKCREKLRQLKMSQDTIVQCSGFNDFSSDKCYDFIFIPSGSFSLLIEKEEIIKSLNRIKGLAKKGGRIIIEVESDLNFSDYNLLGNSDHKKTVKDNNVEISLTQKIVKLDYENKVLFSTCTYKLYDNGLHCKTETESFNLKCYGKMEFDKLLEDRGFQLQAKYIDYFKTAYIGQATDKIIYEMLNL